MTELTYAIGDIHGMHDIVVAALRAIVDHAAGRSHEVVFLGDYVDRGPSGRKVVGLLRRGPVDADQRWIALRGNHEEMMIAACGNASLAMGDWLSNGGRATLENYRVDDAYDAEALRKDVDFLETLPLRHVAGGRLFVHAGVRPGVPLEAQTDEDLLWIRDDFIASDDDHGLLVVHGHTPTARREPEVRPNRIAIDTGAYEIGGMLTVAVFGKDVAPIEFILVRGTGVDLKFGIDVVPGESFATNEPDRRFASWD